MLLFLFFDYSLILFDSVAQLIIPIGIPRKEEKAKIEIHLVIADAKRRKGSI